MTGSEFKLEEGDSCGLEVLEVREGDDGVLVVFKVLDETLARVEDCAFHGRIDLGDRYDHGWPPVTLLVIERIDKDNVSALEDRAWS